MKIINTLPILFPFLLLFGYILIGIFGIRRITSTNDTLFLNQELTNKFRGLAILAILLGHCICFILFPETKSITDSFFKVFATIGAGVFFFLSGYGNTLSYKKKYNTNYQWLFDKCAKLYIPVIIIHFTALLMSHYVNINWYIKEQLLAYIITFLSFKIFKNRYIIAQILFWLIFTASLAFMHASPALWTATLCFPIGVIVAEYKNKLIPIINEYKIHFSIILLLLACTFYILLIPLRYSYLRFFLIMLLCINICALLMPLSLIFKIKSKLLDYAGKYSLENLTIHWVLIPILLPKLHIMNPNLLCIEIILIIFIVFLFSKPLHIISEKLYKIIKSIVINKK